MTLFRLVLASAALAVGPLWAGDYAHPYGATIDRIIRDGDTQGWEVVAGELQRELFRAHDRGTDDVEALYLLHRWAEVFATAEGVHTHRWTSALNETGLGHPNMPARYDLIDSPLGLRYSRATKRRFLFDHTFSRELFSTLTPYDRITEVLDVLERIVEAEPRRFEQYGNLAIAIAVVYDMPPPTSWPHFQVTEEMLPRELPDPVAIFRYFADLRDDRRADLDVMNLPAEVLKYVVDTPASFADFAWAVENVTTPHEYFEDVYSTIDYRFDRVDAMVYIWGDPVYSLANIRRWGGICVDQAYYSATAGKARGIPTVIFLGANNDGRHAWFGYRRPDGSWMFDAGRLGSNAFVSGVAFDPQTWGPITDHELQFLSERFRQTAYYRHSQLEAWMADLYLDYGTFEQALAAAEEAVRYEPRNRQAWEALLRVSEKMGEGPDALEEKLRRAAQAFRSVPDLEVAYTEQLIAHLQAQGETALADRERQTLARKHRTDRQDLAIRQAAATMEESMRTAPVREQLRTFRGLLARYGARGGAAFLDGVGKPFLLHLVDQGETRHARRIAEEIRNHLYAPPRSQLANELIALDRLFAGS